MAKYFFTPAQKHGDTVVLDGDTAHHLLHVLRMAPGEKLILCDGAETDYAAVIEEAHPKKPQVICTVKQSAPACTEPQIKITLYQGLPKGDKLELIIQKCVELGIYKIVPVATTRSIPRTKADTKKALRYQRIAASAAGQSMRGIVPEVCETVTFANAAANMDCSHLTLVAYEAENEQTLKAVLSHNQNKHINIWIGPEGGFTPEEVLALAEKGANIVTLGRRILRTETAAIAATAQILCLMESEG